MIKQLSGLEYKDGKGRKVIAAHSYNAWGESTGYGLWAHCENYKAGKIVKTWRRVTVGQTKEEVIAEFKKRANRCAAAAKRKEGLKCD